MSILHNAFRHFILINRHKFWVFAYCAKAGLIRQGLFHDVSKFSPVEFFESVKYYDGKMSPIVKCKLENEVSLAWLHHKGRNKHHYEYWQDDFDHGTNHLHMPYEYAMEMICDYLAAGHTYVKKEFSYKGEYEWWLEKQKIAAMDERTKRFVDSMLKTMVREDSCNVLRFKRSYFLYILNSRKH